MLLVSGRFPVSQTIIPEAQEHFLTPSAHRDTHIFGGLGFSLVRDMSHENMVRVYWREVVRFFDEKCPKNVGHVTGVVGVLGEDLGAAAFKHCVEANRLGRVRIHDGRVKGVGLMGPWLDRWIEVNSEGWGDLLFQAEVKSSSAYATLGKTLSIETGGDELVVRKRAAWRKEWDETARCLKSPATGKVLVRMTPTEDFGQRRQVPLLIFLEGPCSRF